MVKQEHPHAQCLVRLNVGSATRSAERDDLIEEHDPVLNQGLHALGGLFGGRATRASLFGNQPSTKIEVS